MSYVVPLLLKKNNINKDVRDLTVSLDLSETLLIGTSVVMVASY